MAFKVMSSNTCVDEHEISLGESWDSLPFSEMNCINPWKESYKLKQRLPKESKEDKAGRGSRGITAIPGAGPCNRWFIYSFQFLKASSTSLCLTVSLPNSNLQLCSLNYFCNFYFQLRTPYLPNKSFHC